MEKFIIYGNPITKKNSQRLISIGGRPRILPSKQYIEYEKSAGLYLQPLGIDYPCNVKCVYYMQTRRKVDLCNLLNATCDILVKFGVIEDDNCRIVVSHNGSCVDYSKERPRVEIEIERV